MPLKKIQIRPGVNRENTRYTTEGGWYETDKVRFRQGSPEKIGGWERFSTNTYLGVCRSLWNWVTLSAKNLLGVGTNLKFYIEQGGLYKDITPIRLTTAAGDVTFAAVNGDATLTVTDTAHGAIAGDYVTFSGAVSLGGNITAVVLNQEYAIATIVDDDNYTIEAKDTSGATVLANASDTGNGGASVVGAYQINTGQSYAVPLIGWGGGAYGLGPWGLGTITANYIRLWSQGNFGEDLVFAPRGGALFYWDATNGTSTRGVYVKDITVSTTAAGDVTFAAVNGDATLTVTDTAHGAIVGQLVTFSGAVSLGGNITAAVLNHQYEIATVIDANSYTVEATDSDGTPVLANASDVGNGGASVVGAYQGLNVPQVLNVTLVSDIYRFAFCFGCNEIYTTTLDPMLIRWSAQEDLSEWTPTALNQAGSLRLSQGSEIITALQARQELFVITNSAVYGLQYLGAPEVWGAQLLGTNISIAGQNAAIFAGNTLFWMGKDKFYMYDGTVKPLVCNIRKYIFTDFNDEQYEQVYAGLNEGFHEIWWFYCSSSATTNDRYAVYNYVENIWYYGTLARTAWLDSGLRDYPIAATYSNNLVYHELGNDDNETDSTLPIEAYVTSSEFDLDDGHQFNFITRMLPDVTFVGSTTPSPSISMTLSPMDNSGSGYKSPLSEGGNSSASVTRSATVPIEEFTGQVYIRVRGRQMAIKVASTAEGVAWQLGSPRFDMRPDGRRG